MKTSSTAGTDRGDHHVNRLDLRCQLHPRRWDTRAIAMKASTTPSTARTPVGSTTTSLSRVMTRRIFESCYPARVSLETRQWTKVLALAVVTVAHVFHPRVSVVHITMRYQIGNLAPILSKVRFHPDTRGDASA